MQNFPVPKKSVRQWTEWFKSFKGNKEVLRGPSYEAALKEIDTWMRDQNEGEQAIFLSLPVGPYCVTA